MLEISCDINVINPCQNRNYFDVTCRNKAISRSFLKAVTDLCAQWRK